MIRGLSGAASAASGPAARPPLLRLAGLAATPRNGDAALSALSLDLAFGGFVSLLGRAGSGQTTALALVAGLAAPTAGDILLDGHSIRHLPSHRRGIGAVFRHPALFPARRLAENVAFPLAMRRVSGGETARRVDRVLHLLGLGGQGARRVEDLNGLERRLAALARAIVFAPALLLLDEPCAGLDPRDRDALQLTLCDIRRGQDLTILHATSDPAEALALADHIALLRDGALHQQAAPEVLYERPVSAFAASVTGETNLLPGTVRSIDDAIGTIRLDCGPRIEAEPVGVAAGQPCLVAIRPERIATASADPADLGPHALQAILHRRLYRGDHLQLHLRVGDTTLIAKRPIAAHTPQEGHPVALAWSPQHARAFPRVV